MSLITDELVRVVRTVIPCLRSTSANRAKNVLSSYCLCLIAARAVPRVLINIVHSGRSVRLAWDWGGTVTAHISVSENLSPEGFIALEVDCFIDEHGERLVGEEEVLFFCAKDASQVQIGSGAEVVGDGGLGVDSIDFIAVTSYEGVLPCELSEGGGDGGIKDVACLHDCCDLHGNLLGKAAFRGSVGATCQLWPRVAATSLHHRGPQHWT
jgi:hypothetical protein